ncbi:hypothetical protein WOLCODRAFT_154105 [Wolfiporia cocos MD-104 SS10]|uniref:Uncharacterized protein n=1 Tax=Wolfiporia cocos (strain MD-104) TaxID=742152 RepID=A0A2H3JVQ0_WOLCO|nr:hypothetical protein WOLCODRAFT_154105 [Wolfiporia cocos MD-104 SS10]
MREPLESTESIELGRFHESWDRCDDGTYRHAFPEGPGHHSPSPISEARAIGKALRKPHVSAHMYRDSWMCIARMARAGFERPAESVPARRPTPAAFMRRSSRQRRPLDGVENDARSDQLCGTTPGRVQAAACPHSAA